MEKSNRGGAREGAGRKPKALRWAAELAAAEGKIVKAAPRIIAALVRAAQDGDVGAARYLLDRVWGRIAEQAKPIAEDYALPAEHPAKPALARKARTEALAEEMVPYGFAGRPFRVRELQSEFQEYEVAREEGEEATKAFFEKLRKKGGRKQEEPVTPPAEEEEEEVVEMGPSMPPMPRSLLKKLLARQKEKLEESQAALAAAE
jgi:hypothetical protein